MVETYFDKRCKNLRNLCGALCPTNETWWKCNEKCITTNQPCDQECHYEPLFCDNMNLQWQRMNIPIYCKDTHNCTIMKTEACHFYQPWENKCMNSKEVCTSSSLKFTHL